MQIKFLTALLLLGVCFTQVPYAHPQTTAEGNNVADSISKANQAIEAIQSIIKQKTDDAIKTFSEFKDQVEDHIQIAIEEAYINLNPVIATAQKRIQAIKKKAQELGTDISPCLTNSEDRFKDIFDKFIQYEVICIKDEVNEAITLINESIQIAEDEWKTVENLPEELQACGTNSSSLPCINQVIVKVAKLQFDLPVEIAQKVIEVSAFVGGLKVRLEACAASEVAKAGLEAAGVVANVAVCAATQTGQNIFGNF